MDQEYYTIPEAAQKLRVTPAAIRKWIAQGKMDVVYVGSDRRITSEELDAFVARSTEARKSRRDGSSATIEEVMQSPSHVAVLQLT
jgi:excisionase family DNA binding protein